MKIVKTLCPWPPNDTLMSLQIVMVRGCIYWTQYGVRVSTYLYKQHPCNFKTLKRFERVLVYENRSFDTQVLGIDIEMYGVVRP